jgi:hypothetical protein
MIVHGLNRILFLSLLLLVVAWNNILSQEIIDLFSTNNRLAFGNYLFCEKDYLRAIDEYNAILAKNWDDTLQFKIATSFYRMGQYNKANIEFQKIGVQSSLYQQTQYERYRTLFKSGHYAFLQNEVDETQLKRVENPTQLLRLKYSTWFLVNSTLSPKMDFVSAFKDEDKTEISELYDWKLNPRYKSKTKAAIMSAIIPGLGKIYANEVGDGITAFLLTGLFTYLAIDKFDKQQQTSAWLLYTALAAFFYSGNIYGSAAAVQNYNAGIKFNFEREVKLFINDRNQFLPTPKFLCD